MILMDNDSENLDKSPKVMKLANDQHMTTSFHSLLKDKSEFK